MEERNLFAWHEGDMARMERANKRLWVVIIILIIALIGSNVAWIYYESQFETVITEIEAEQETADGGNNYISGGDIYEPTESKGNN